VFVTSYRGIALLGASPSDAPDARRAAAHAPAPSPAAGTRKAPALRRPDGEVAKVDPPAGEDENWWRRLNKALDTTSSDFVNASLLQSKRRLVLLSAPFQTPTSMPLSPSSRSAPPRDEIEAPLSVQMARTRRAAMAVLAKLEVVSEQSGELWRSAQQRLV
jgi:hypothetical protein